MPFSGKSSIIFSKETVVVKTTRKKIGAIVVGLIVILVGVGYAAKTMGYELDLSSLLFDGWWTVFIPKA